MSASSPVRSAASPSSYASSAEAPGAASPLPFCVPDARLHCFGSKDEYLAFRAAWKALARSRTPLPPLLHAAFAIVSGRDLYRAFSPSRRPHHAGEPYSSLARALVALSMPYAVEVLLEVRPALAPDSYKVLRAALVKACGYAASLDLRRRRDAQRVVASGAGAFLAFQAPGA